MGSDEDDYPSHWTARERAEYQRVEDKLIRELAEALFIKLKEQEDGNGDAGPSLVT